MIKDSNDLLDNVEITTIAAECVKLKEKEDEIAALEDQLKKKKEEADDIGSRVIPELLAEQGLSEIKLADGSKVSVKKEFRATIPKDELRREQALQWLRDQGLGDIIKNNVTVSFGKGEDDKAGRLSPWPMVAKASKKKFLGKVDTMVRGTPPRSLPSPAWRRPHVTFYRCTR